MFEKLKADYASPILDILLFQRYKRFLKIFRLMGSHLVSSSDIAISFHTFPNFSRISHVLCVNSNFSETRASRIMEPL